MDRNHEFSERELWRQCLPEWAINFFLAPFADEVGPVRATLAWTARCAVFSLFVAAVLPDRLLEPVASGALIGVAAVMLLAILTHVRPK